MQGTIDWKRVVFVETKPPARPLMSDIKAIVAAHYEITVAHIEGESLKRNHTWPRQVTMALGRKMTKLSLSRVGESVNKDHTCALCAQRKVAEMERDNPVFADELRQIRRQVIERAERRLVSV